MSTNVNVPTNVRQREKDIDNKLRLYGIYQGMDPLVLGPVNPC